MGDPVVPCALNGPDGPGPNGPPWVLKGRALMGRALMGPSDPYCAPLGSKDIYICTYIYVYIHLYICILKTNVPRL